AYTLQKHLGSDFVIDESSVKTTPEIVTADLDSFLLEFDIVNLGRNNQDSFQISVEHKDPIGNIFTKTFDTNSGRHRMNQSLQIRLASTDVIGQNEFKIQIDAENVIDEQPATAESNNSYEFDILIFDSDISPVYPPSFAKLNCEDVVLVASTSNPITEKTSYILEIDTTEFFNSPLKASTEILNNGGIVQWAPSLAYTENTVYYWRVAKDTMINNSLPWRYSNFLYAPSELNYGWNQSHYFQFLDNNLENIVIDTMSRNWEFQKFFGELKIINRLHENGELPEYIIQANRPSYASFWERNADLIVVVYDPLDFNIWLNDIDNKYNTDNTRFASFIRNFAFKTSNFESRKNFITFIEDSIPDGHFVEIHSQVTSRDQDIKAEEWAADSLLLEGRNIFNVLENQGSQLIRQFTNLGLVPYCITYKKGEQLLDEAMSSRIGESLEFNSLLFAFLSTGNIQSTIIGPGQRWIQMNNEFVSQVSDSFELEIAGITDDGQRQILKQFDSAISSIDLTDIDPAVYPSLQLAVYHTDNLNRTPADLLEWSVDYDGLPDAAVASRPDFPDTVLQGQELTINFSIFNPSKYQLDSILVKFRITDTQNRSTEVFNRYGSIESFDSISVKHSFNTSELEGRTIVSIELNPNQDQPELYTFNNFAVFPVFVDSDRVPPILDVLFDGNRIMNGDIVAPRPTIEMFLKDENLTSLIRDSTTFTVFLKIPGESSFSRISSATSELEFFPASLDNKNTARLVWNPSFEIDGIYTLQIQARDNSGNKSGNINFLLDFEVILRKSISKLVPYPNPFTTSTRFLYTLTGDLPEFFKIQIMTVSGQVVKEIDLQEFGSLRIGEHLSDYTWNGTDKYGDKLANGIYLYRVITTDDSGESFENFSIGNAESYFGKDLGKIVILR
ncbi:MAG: hypothetical protein OEM26_13215, partial [Saprospiraceae bacterium]|nr:hypothetical protein [Saprospiraceae bacterium]